MFRKRNFKGIDTRFLKILTDLLSYIAYTTQRLPILSE